MSSRIKDLAGTTSATGLQNLIDSLYLAIDDDSYSEAEKVLFKSFIVTAAITGQGGNVEHQMMSPKSFKASTMTTTETGIGKLSTEAKVTDKSGDLLKSTHQTVMQAQWLKDWFENNGTEKAVKSNSFTAPDALSWDANAFKAFALNETHIVSPALPAGKRFHAVRVAWVSNSATIVTTDESLLVYTGSEFPIAFLESGGTVWATLVLSADGRSIYIKSLSGVPMNLKGSISFNAVTKDI